MIGSIRPGLLAGTSGEASRPQANDIRGAAGQFEALLMGQLLKSARASGAGWLDDGEDQAGATATDLAEEQLAQALARQGGLGLARMVADHLQRGESGRGST